MSNTSDQGGGAVQSVDRAISILQVLAREGAAGVTQIAAHLDVHKSTVSRLMATLEARGLVEQLTNRGQYQLAYGVVQLAVGATRRHDITSTSRSACEQLAETVGETVNVVVLDGSEILTVDQVIGSGTMTTVNWAGQRSPLHATSAGKVFLAAMSADERRALLPARLEKFTDQTLVSRSALQAQLEIVSAEGFGYTLEEFEPGLASIAAPIRDLSSDVVAAVAVSGPIFRVNPETFKDIRPALAAAASIISERNGYPVTG